MKARLDQGSVPSPLLFIIMMDDVMMKEARSGLRSELMYADQIILMVPNEEALRRKLECRSSLLVNVLTLNAGVMV